MRLDRFRRRRVLLRSLRRCIRCGDRARPGCRHCPECLLVKAEKKHALDRKPPASSLRA